MVTDVLNLSCYIITSHLVCMKSGGESYASFLFLPLFNQFMSFYGFKTCILKLQVHSHPNVTRTFFMESVFIFLDTVSAYLVCVLGKSAHLRFSTHSPNE